MDEKHEERADMLPEKSPPFRIREQKSQSKVIPSSALVEAGKSSKPLPDREKI